MELRVLQYFLAVAREQSILKASEALHLSQPTLSRQLRDLEAELGKQLFIRGNRKITLTEEGVLFRKRAEEIIDLVKKTENEIMLSEDSIAGDIYIGAGETDAIRLIARTAAKLQAEHPLLHYHIFSGDSQDVLERLDKGLLDFGIVFNPTDLSSYHHISIPKIDRWGVLMRQDAPLAKKDSIRPEDLWDKPLILSRQQKEGSELSLWLKKSFSELNIAATYNLLFNGSLMVDEGLGYALCLDGIINTSGHSHLCFKPLEPALTLSMNLVWKKYQVFSKAVQQFLEQLKSEIERFWL
ncbi:MAG: LysR family transcriptional regulator [Clostridiales bacterium]|nr:LysR family transcriptional regulator [Clostridiales bacterium]